MADGQTGVDLPQGAGTLAWEDPQAKGRHFLSVFFCDQNRHFHSQMACSSVQNLEELIKLRFLTFEQIIVNPVAHDLHAPLSRILELLVVILKDLLPEERISMMFAAP